MDFTSSEGFSRKYFDKLKRDQEIMEGKIEPDENDPK